MRADSGDSNVTNPTDVDGEVSEARRKCVTFLSHSLNRAE